MNVRANGRSYFTCCIFCLFAWGPAFAGTVLCRIDSCPSTIHTTETANITVSVKYSPGVQDLATAPYEIVELSLWDADTIAATADHIYTWQGDISISAAEAGTWKQCTFYSRNLTDFDGIDSDGVIELYVKAVVHDFWPNEEAKSDSVDVTIKPRISGNILTASGTPISGVRIPTEGYGFGATTDSEGHYAFQVPWGFSGSVTPGKSGWTFSPSSRTYSQVKGNQANNHYAGVSAPSKPTNSDPSNAATNQSIDINISWSDGGGAASYDVYFGTDSSPDSGEYKGNQSIRGYDPGTLSYGTTYYWRIDAKNAAGTTTGDVWHFSVAPAPPSKATNPSPGNGATNQPRDVDVSWSNGGGATNYVVYFGTDATPDEGELGSYQSSSDNDYDPGALSYGTTYYWRVDSRNSGGETQGDVWSFQTISVSSITISGEPKVREDWGSTYKCTALYSDGSSKEVGATWQIISGGSYAQINGSGTLTTSSVSKDETCVIQATSQGKSTTYTVTIEYNTPGFLDQWIR